MEGERGWRWPRRDPPSVPARRRNGKIRRVRVCDGAPGIAVRLRAGSVMTCERDN